jgi:putative multicomponent Na+:H+ antiporter subunit B
MDITVYAITALLPLAAAMVIFQKNPYHALVIRGILGAIAALVYTVLGAADVALTEALVGTLLAITLYAIAVRSSLVLRLGVLEQAREAVKTMEVEPASPFHQWVENLNVIFGKYYMRVELVPHPDQKVLHEALMDKEVHAICIPCAAQGQGSTVPETTPYHVKTRLRRLYDIMQAELVPSTTRLTYVNLSDSEVKPGEVHP